MDDEYEKVALLLSRTADLGGDFSPPPLDSLTERATPRRPGRTVGAVLCVVAIVALIAVGAATLTTGTRNSSEHVEATDPATVHALLLVAQRFATLNDGTILQAQAVQATGSKVWTIQIESQTGFTCEHCPLTTGATTPTGRYIVLVLGGERLGVTKFSIGDRRTDLSRLGTVVSLYG